MKYFITESQVGRLLTEEVEGLGSFLYTMGESFPIVDQYYGVLKSEIEKSKCQKIEWCNFSVETALGASFSDGVLINRRVLEKSLGACLFTIFHEIAHQYQYKKYGADFAIKCYQEDIDIKEAVKIIKKTENVADEYGIRKCRELVKIGLITNKEGIKIGPYRWYSDKEYETYIIQMREKIKQSGLTSTDEISSMLYNWIKSLV